MAYVRVALLCALVAVSHAVDTSVARGSKVVTGKICLKSDSACVSARLPITCYLVAILLSCYLDWPCQLPATKYNLR
jgi:hypothetical protein